MKPRRQRLASVALLAGASLLPFALTTAPVLAADADVVAVARAAYDRGAAAYNSGKYALAAREFTQADELAPNPVALRFALQAALKIDDPVLGMRLVERARQEGADLGGIAREARDKFARRVGRITLVCPVEGTCRARVDGEPANATTWVTPGPHAVEWEPQGRGSITVGAGEAVQIDIPSASPTATATASTSPTTTPTATPPNPPPEDSGDGGMSPAWFWVGIGLTTIGVAGTIASGLDTLHQHDVFAAHPGDQTQHDGQSAQRRTNVILGVTAALGATTAALGIFAVRWSNGGKKSAYLDLQIRGPGFAVTFRH